MSFRNYSLVSTLLCALLIGSQSFASIKGSPVTGSPGKESPDQEASSSSEDDSLEAGIKGDNEKEFVDKVMAKLRSPMKDAFQKAQFTVIGGDTKFAETIDGHPCYGVNSTTDQEHKKIKFEVGPGTFKAPFIGMVTNNFIRIDGAPMVDEDGEPSGFTGSRLIELFTKDTAAKSERLKGRVETLVSAMTADHLGILEVDQHLSVTFLVLEKTEHGYSVVDNWSGQGSEKDLPHQDILDLLDMKN